DTFIPQWGPEYDQSETPLKEMTEAKGHAVRAGYIYSAMADAAYRFSDPGYESACERIYDNIVERKMYITGGIGSTNDGEAFTVDYDLPNRTAYAETCAAIALAYFARRMLRLKPDSRYADTIERVMYNGALSGVSLDGKRFFYSNPMEIDTRSYDRVEKKFFYAPERAEMFWCSCCPPNILRFIASIADDFYTYSGDTLYIHQFAESSANIRGASVTQETSYPADGKVRIRVTGDFRIMAIRLPGWCSSFTLSEPYTVRDGYAYVEIPESGEITVSFDMPVRLVEANGAVRDDVGKVAVTRGPIVYCVEGKDNGDPQTLFLTESAPFEEAYSDGYGVHVLKTKGLRRHSCEGLYAPYRPAFEPAEMTFIPYFAAAERGGDDMSVWIKIIPDRD
ncbi:MAG: glycoside hydrolase family 127 protein, partial [Clostridia bacterium]|nr:glycoside hydrolase family 127 protein [Clostridia bacterium]